jgi:hypothetical protein
MVGLSGIIHAPSPTDQQFTDPDQLNALIEAVEGDDRLYVSLADIWLPNHLFVGHSNRVNDVFRLSEKLFSEAYRYRHGRQAMARFVSVSRDFLQAIRYSEIETKVINSWITRQLDSARETYPKNAELALP